MAGDKAINENYFFDELLLMYLFKKEEVSTKEIEEKFGSLNDYQNVNNVISNNENNTSYIKKGYMIYDEKNQLLKITNKGKDVIKDRFSKRRSILD